MPYGNYSPFYRPNFFNPMPFPTMPMQPPQDVGQFGAGFQPPMPGAQAHGAPGGEMILVLNENEATSYPVAPGNTVTLWDKNLTTIYIKSVDMNGVPSMRILDCKERVQGPAMQDGGHQCHCAGRYAPIADFEALRQDVARLSATVDSMRHVGTSVYEKKEEGINE